MFGAMQESFSRGPICGRSVKTPDIRGPFQFYGDLKKISDGVRALHPGNASAHIRMISRLRQFQRDPSILRQVMFGRIAASVKIQRESSRAFFKRLA
jgi:hypothetical protein